MGWVDFSVGSIRRSFLQGNIVGTPIRILSKEEYHGCVGQNGTINIPVLSSSVIFWTTLPIMEKVGKA